MITRTIPAELPAALVIHNRGDETIAIELETYPGAVAHVAPGRFLQIEQDSDMPDRLRLYFGAMWCRVPKHRPWPVITEEPPCSEI